MYMYCLEFAKFYIYNICGKHSCFLIKQERVAPFASQHLLTTAFRINEYFYRSHWN